MTRGCGRRGDDRAPGSQLAYLVAAVCFILALKGLSSPRTARNGNLIGAVRRRCSPCVTTLFAYDLDHLPLILGAIAVGTRGGGVHGAGGCR